MTIIDAGWQLIRVIRQTNNGYVHLTVMQPANEEPIYTPAVSVTLSLSPEKQAELVAAMKGQP